LQEILKGFIAMKNIAAHAHFSLEKPQFTSKDADQHLLATRAQTTALVAHLSADDCQIQSMADTSPTKWHLAHTTWFFETFIVEKFETGFTPHDERFRVLFNSYYMQLGARHPRAQRGLISRPTLAEVHAYRLAVDARLQALLAQRRDDAQLRSLVALGIEHEQQHQELILTDIKHMLSCNPAKPAYAKRWPLQTVRPQPLQWIGFEGGLVQTGFDALQDGTFCFDNETPRHPAWLQPFELASRLVTYGDYMAFIEDHGYTRPELWLSMGWDWVQNTGGAARSLPLYWHKTADGSYRNFTLQGDVAVDSNTPVCHLSYFEADAFARWAGARLPTEHEWEHAARSAHAASIAQGNFAESKSFHPLPLRQASANADRADPGQASTPRIAQLWGDVWEWTASNYNPYPGYRAWEGAVGEYNGKFMCNQFVLRGGSCATPQSHIRAGYRNFFPPDAQWQFSGLRLAR
jgi:ergothioneine biosynthesis protein EgtB